MVLIPAYGRTYHSPEACLEDWIGGLDFKIHGGSYCSIRDIELIKETKR